MSTTNKIGEGELRNRVIKYMVLAVLGIALVLFLMPILVIIINSFKTEADLFRNGPFALPERYTLDVFRAAWERVDYTQKLINSIQISVVVAFCAVGISTLNAYALGIGKIKGSQFMLILFVLCMTMPREALVYPLYYLFNLFGIYDTKISVIFIMIALHSSYGTYLLTSIFRTFPKALIESAKIDGCGIFRTLFHVVLPLTMPSLSVLFVFFFIWTWNEFFIPFIFLMSNDNMTVSLSVTMLQGARMSEATLQSAAALLGIIPCLIFFVVFQRTFNRGITSGGIKE